MTVHRRHFPALLAATFAVAVATPSAAAQQPDTSGTGGVEARPGTLEVPPVALAKRPLRVAGSIGPGARRRRVVVQRRSGDGRWRRVAVATADRDGAFTARWTPAAAGRHALRAGLAPDRRRGRARGRAAQARDLFGQVTVYAAEVASWYGPGFFGKTTACGMELTPETVGVAHKALPCGTRVEFYYRGRTLELPVIDRGPYVAGRQWDLTQAAAERLGVSGTVRLGVLRAG